MRKVFFRDLITKVEGREPNDARSPFTRLEEPSNKVSGIQMIQYFHALIHFHLFRNISPKRLSCCSRGNK